jgi:hypothetical protein
LNWRFVWHDLHTQNARCFVKQSRGRLLLIVTLAGGLKRGIRARETCKIRLRNRQANIFFAGNPECILPDASGKFFARFSSNGQHDFNWDAMGR